MQALAVMPGDFSLACSVAYMSSRLVTCKGHFVMPFWDRDAEVAAQAQEHEITFSR